MLPDRDRRQLPARYQIAAKAIGSAATFAILFAAISQMPHIKMGWEIEVNPISGDTITAAEMRSRRRSAPLSERYKGRQASPVYPSGGPPGDVSAAKLFVDGTWVGRMVTATDTALCPDCYGGGASATWGGSTNRGSVNVHKVTSRAFDNALNLRTILEDSVSACPTLDIVLVDLGGEYPTASISPGGGCVIVAGQYAPATLFLHNFTEDRACTVISGSGDHYVWWGLTVRAGSHKGNQNEGCDQNDAWTVGQADNVYYRNISASYGSDGNFSFAPTSTGNRGTYITIERMLSGYGYKIHTEFSHVAWSSLCRNVWITTGLPNGSSGWRMPAADSHLYSEFCQNVGYNTTVRWITGFGPASDRLPDVIDIYDYYFKQGPMTGSQTRYIQMGSSGNNSCNALNPDSVSLYLGRMVIDSIKSDSLSSWWTNNFIQCSNASGGWESADSSTFGAGHSGDLFRAAYTRIRDLFPDSIPFPFPDLTPQQVHDSLVDAGGPQDVGNWYALDEFSKRAERRDSIDIQMLDEFNNRTGVTRDSAGAYFTGGGQAGEVTIGFDTACVNNCNSLTDSDGGGLPDSFEVLLGTSNADANDDLTRTLNNGNAGPTYLECFIFEFAKFGHELEWGNDSDADSFVVQDSVRGSAGWNRLTKQTPPDTTYSTDIEWRGDRSYRVIYHGSNQDTTGINTPGPCAGVDTVGA